MRIKLVGLHWLVSALLSTIGVFLSMWMLIPAPTLTLLPLSIGVSELSPWLVIGNLISVLVAAVGFRYHQLYRLAFVSSLASLTVSALPLLQLPAMTHQADTVLTQVLGAGYLNRVPLPSKSQMRQQPFVWTDAMQGIPAQPVRRTSGIIFAQPEGVSLKFNLYQPIPPGLYPGVIMIYGGAWQRGEPSQNAEFGSYLAARGYVVWAIDYRHAPQYRFPTQLEDVRSALQFIQQHAAEYETDLQQLVLMGRSAGSHLAMLAAYEADAPQFRAVVNYYGPVNLLAGYYDLPQPDVIDSRSVLNTLLGGPPDQLGELYRQASPYYLVRAGLPPTLLIYGGRDHIVESRFGRAMSDRLQSAGNQAAFIEIPWADHAFDAIFAGISNQAALYYTERFLAWALSTPRNNPMNPLKETVLPPGSLRMTSH